MGQGDPTSENVASLPEFEGTSLLRRHWAVNDVMAQVVVNDVVALVTYWLVVHTVTFTTRCFLVSRAATVGISIDCAPRLIGLSLGG